MNKFTSKEIQIKNHENEDNPKIKETKYIKKIKILKKDKKININ